MSLLEKPADTAHIDNALRVCTEETTSTLTCGDAEESGTSTVREPELLPHTSSCTITASSPPPHPPKQLPPLLSSSESIPSSASFVNKHRDILISPRIPFTSDPVPVPNPLHWIEGYQSAHSTMAKPGAEYSWKPGQIGAKTYSHKNKKRRSNSHDGDILPPNPYHHDREPKRQKLDYSIVDSESTRDVYDLEESSPAQPSVLSSRRSAGSEHSASAWANAFKSEFEATQEITQARRKPPRKSSGPNSNKHSAGYHESAPIDLDDEEDRGRPSESQRLQLHAFTQGIPPGYRGSAKPSTDDTVSSHFSKTPANTNLPKRHSNPKRRSKTDDPENIRNAFKRHPPEDVSDSEDELAASPRKKARTSGPSMSRGVIAPTSNYERGGLPEEGWQLKWARATNHKAIHNQLVLRKGTDKHSWRVVGPDDDGILHTKFQVDLSKMNLAYADEFGRIRLCGSAHADGLRDMVDLHFGNPTHCKVFKGSDLKSSNIKVHGKDVEHMQTIFDKVMPLRHQDGPLAISPKAQRDSRIGTRTSEKQQKPGLLDKLLQTQASTSDVVSDGTSRKSTRTARATRTTRPNYAEPEAAPAESLKFSELRGLGEPWQKQLTYGSGRRRAVIDFTDLQRLDEEEFLNDSLIDFYMIYLFDHSNLPSDKVYFFNTHFFSTLTRKVPGLKQGSINYDGVARWTAKEDIFGYDYIVVPINQDLHWYLAIICNVSNIDRKFHIEGPEELFPSVEASVEISSEPDNAQIVNAEDAASSSRDASLKPIDGSGIPYEAPCCDDEEMLFTAESSLDLVEPGEPTKSTDPVATPEIDLIEGSGDTETTQNMDASTVVDVTDEPSHDAASSSLPTKSKRKPAPPVKRYDPDEPCIIILDSLGNTRRSKVVRALKDYIREEGRAKRSMEAAIDQNAVYPRAYEIPMQDNFSDCGVYVLGYIEKFFKDPDGFKNRVLNKEMNVETDWPNMSVPNMRNDIRTILFNLHKEQTNERKRAHAAKIAHTSGRKGAGDAATIKTQPKPTMRDKKDSPTPIAVDSDKQDNPGASVQDSSSPRTSSSRAGNSPQSNSISTTEIVSPPKPRLASPFEPRSSSKHDTTSPARARSKINKVSRTPEGARQAQNENFEDAQPKSERSIKRPSPQVVIKSPPPFFIPAKEKKRAGSFSDIEVLSPNKSNATKVAPKRSSKDDCSTESPRKKAKAIKTASGGQGCSSDPISIDDSQDTVAVSPVKRVPQEAVHISLASRDSNDYKKYPKYMQDRVDVKRRRLYSAPLKAKARRGKSEIPESPDEEVRSSSLPADGVLPL